MNVMTGAVLKAGRALKRDFGEVSLLQVSRKGPADFVTVADRKSEKILHDELARARPGYGFRMEESGTVEGTDRTHTWHIDPLDGTTNFLHGVPAFCVSVGLERDGVAVAGVIFNPATDELYVAEKGEGCYLNNQRLRVANRVNLDDALISCSIPNIGHGDHPLFHKEVAQVMAKVAGLRRIGATALELAYVAAGRFDGLWHRGFKSWDVAAGAIMIREAGGYITDAEGHPNHLIAGHAVAGNEVMHRELLALLKKARTA
jgi:myo-inositol-1(or 4)-monophosphatase